MKESFYIKRLISLKNQPFLSYKQLGEFIMAKIIENDYRRIIKMSTDDIISVVREYQRLIKKAENYNEIRNILEDTVIYIPEEK